MTSFLVKYRRRDAHVSVALYAGPDDQHRALALHGALRPEEWEDFRDVLTVAAVDVEFLRVGADE